MAPLADVLRQNQGYVINSVDFTIDRIHYEDRPETVYNTRRKPHRAFCTRPDTKRKTSRPFFLFKRVATDADCRHRRPGRLATESESLATGGEKKRGKMDSDKRKRQENGGVEDRRTRAREDDNGGGKQTATEGEVEEFFAILRRIRDAVKYRDKGKKNHDAWRPRFEWEDFEEVKVKVKEKKDERVEENVVLDLNADPVSDRNSV
uniref:Uncharacterized protein n=1 Tax=Nelumbo nucifera TaxID=4432 RepID=A0A822YW26_NELNU|nr:TPA_asm: hypothetical protein HUJ06_005975 [Nelumbo nucifera]